MRVVRSFIGLPNLDWLLVLALLTQSSGIMTEAWGFLDYDVITGHVSAYWATPFTIMMWQFTPVDILQRMWVQHLK